MDKARHELSGVLIVYFQLKLPLLRVVFNQLYVFLSLAFDDGDETRNKGPNCKPRTSGYWGNLQQKIQSGSVCLNTQGNISRP